jgi:hypothetical protein
MAKQHSVNPIFVLEWLTFLLRVRDVPGSNLGPDTGYPECFRGFPQPLQTNAEILP